MDNQRKAFTPRVILQLLVVLGIVPLLPMMISSRWAWPEAWAYAGIHVLGFLLSRALAARRHPDLLAERARSMEMKDAKAWDRKLAPLLTAGLVAVLIVAGLDARNGWTDPFSAGAKIVSLLVIVAGFAFGSWALIENRFFSGVVRIQADRGHHVVTSGPYRFLRHPGYAGALWSYLFTPLFLDSLWAFIPATLTMSVLVVRTALEDRTLHEELPDYREYAHKTRYRLFPGVW
ncbi:MAG: isoprenylcysteine carboxylmethyltransferase family protein [Chloroflexi bacterium]|nr:isoprenylcysteine carboxylmethyltransferase family protein [Chloroflexota bacterium]